MSEQHPARWWHRDEQGRVVCELCPRGCRLKEGQRAFCFVRKNVGGALVLTTYGRSTGFCIDPIEKKPLNHFYPGSAVLSFGTAGCNLGCRYCQNWQSARARAVDVSSRIATPDDIAEAALRSGCRAVAYTYNDPIVFAEYAIDTARACRERGLANVAVTNGYIEPAARAEFYADIDAANVDLKAFAEQFYAKLCGGALAPVLDTLRWLCHETSVWVELATLLIPGHNDSEQDVAALCDWVAEQLGPEVPLHLTAFHPDFRMTDLPPTPPATLRRAREQALAAGLEHVYTGNVHDPAGQSTYCAGCGGLLIERRGYDLGRWQLTDDGCCASCGRKLAGRVDGPPGTWGGRREPVRIG